MNRRTVLSNIFMGLTVGLAGCQGNAIGFCGDLENGTEKSPKTRGPSRSPPESLPVPKSALTRATPKDAIPAITDPKFGTDWSGIELTAEWWGTGEKFTYTPELNSDDLVIGVERDGKARAYPLKLLNWHEVVNDDFDDPLLITYCPLCGSGIVTNRYINDQIATFGVSGFLWRGNLVMYDNQTESLWSQLAATAIRGPLTGEQLTIGPSSLTSLGQWRNQYPDTKVLLPPPISGLIEPASTRPYSRNPYAGYRNSTQVGVGKTDFADNRLHPKTMVFGIEAGNIAVAYPLQLIRKMRVINDVVGSLPVVVMMDSTNNPVAFERRINGQVVRFDQHKDGKVEAVGSKWDPDTGRAISGRHKGEELTQITDAKQLFWFAWIGFHPDSKLYKKEEKTNRGFECAPL